MTYPPVWGPLYHDVLMFFAVHYPAEPTEREREEATRFIELFFKFLPCPQCILHSRIFFNNYPPEVGSNTDLVRWVVKMHNHVNDLTSKKSDWTPEEALRAFRYRYFDNQIRLSRSDEQRKEDHRLLKRAQTPPVEQNGTPVNPEPDTQIKNQRPEVATRDWVLLDLAAVVTSVALLCLLAAIAILVHRSFTTRRRFP